MIRKHLPQIAGCAAFAGAAFFVGSALTAHDAVAQEADLVLGEEVYRTQCESCHGQEGKVDGPAARFLETTPRDLTTGDWMYVSEVSQAEVERVTRDGIADTEMEPFGELLLDWKGDPQLAYENARRVRFITQPKSIRKILTHQGEPLESHLVSPARGPPVA